VDAEVAFLATPAEVSHELAPRLLARGLRVVDLSGAFRLAEAAAYPGWYATLSAAYGQGLTERDDLGLSASVTWSTSELVLGGFWHRQLGQASGWDLAGRLAAGWYLDGGSTLIYDDNLSDRGLQLTPGFVASRRGVGLLSVAFDLPFTITTWRGGGTWIAPRASVSYEVALYEQLALGVLGSLAWRGGTGGAPMRAGQVLPELLVTATWKLD
jgi:hypothetical protein